MKTIDYRDILHPRDLTIQQSEITLVRPLITLPQHCLVGQILMHLAQIALIQPHKRVEPQQAADQLHRQPVPTVTLSGVQPFVAQHLLQLSIAHATATHNNIAEEGERGFLAVGHRHMKTSLTNIRVPAQLVPQHTITHCQQKHTHRYPSPINHPQHRPHIQTTGHRHIFSNHWLLHNVHRSRLSRSRQLQQIAATPHSRRRDNGNLRMHQRQQQTQPQRCQQKETVHIQAMLPPQQQAVQPPEQSCAYNGKKQIACHFSNSLVNDSRSSSVTAFLSTRNDTMLRNDDPK